jgi:hypothetical protein
MGGLEFVIYLIASYIISYALQPKAKGPDAASQADFDFPQVDEGTPQAVIFGDCWSSDWTVLAVGNFRTSAISQGGGK